MPIAVSCPCGRAIRAPDNLAGKKVRCPKCADVVTIPSPSPLPAELVDEDTAITSFSTTAPAAQNELTFEPVASRPRSSPPPLRQNDSDEDDNPFTDDGDDADDDRPSRQSSRSTGKRKPKKSIYADKPREGRQFGTINAGVIGGVAMIAIAVVWFVVGLSFNRIFFYPPILLIMGIIAIIKGIVSGG